MKTIDWHTELKLALLNAPTQEKFEELKEAAESWVTCAVGKECYIIPRDMYGCPKDETLSSFGISFMNQVERKAWRQAKHTLDLIETRSAELIAKLS